MINYKPPIKRDYSFGHGALCGVSWTPHKQAKFVVRHLTSHLMTGVKFTGFFSTLDMVEALEGNVHDIKSILDYGYFGVLGAEFDEKGISIGEYSPKPSYYALQALASIFSETFEKTDLPILIDRMDKRPVWDTPHMGRVTYEYEMLSCGFEKKGCKAFVYWKPTSLLFEEFMGETCMEISNMGDDVLLVDPIDGSVYKIPEMIMSKDEYGTVRLLGLPVKDSPLILMFGQNGKYFADFTPLEN